MASTQQQRLETQLWNIANELRGKMNADEFRNYILGFIFFKFLSEKQHLFANRLLETEDVKEFTEVTDHRHLEAIREESLEKLGYFLKPDGLFSTIVAKGNVNLEEESNFITDDLSVFFCNQSQKEFRLFFVVLADSKAIQLLT